MIKIPENELRFEFARAGGPGGQHVNRRETKVRVRWNINDSKALTEKQRERLRQSPLIRLTIDGDIIVEHDKERRQERNREIAVERLHELVNKALKKKKKRKKIEKRESTLREERKWRKRESEKKKFRRESRQIKKYF